jgi:hypothetical protein
LVVAKKDRRCFHSPGIETALASKLLITRRDRVAAPSQPPTFYYAPVVPTAAKKTVEEESPNATKTYSAVPALRAVHQ